MDKRSNPGTNGQPKKKKAKKQPASKKVKYVPPNANEIQTYKGITAGVVRDRSPVGKYALQCMLPQVDYAVLIPDENEHARCTRVFKRVVTIDSSKIIQTGDYAGSCLIALPPNPEMPGYTTEAGTVLIPAEPSQVRCVLSGFSFRGGSTGPLNAHARVADYVTKEEAVIPFRQITVDSATFSGFAVAAENAMTCRVTVTNKGNKIFRFGVWDATAANWERRAMTETLNYNVPQTIDFTSRAGMQHIGFRLWKVASDDPYYDDSGVKIPISVVLELGYAGSNDACQVSSSEEIQLYKGIGEFVTDSAISHARLTAVGALLKNTTAPINRQGNIMVTRAPFHILSELANLSEAISRLPQNRRYVGQAENGGYGWWFPASQTTQAFAEIHEARQNLLDDELLLFYVSGLKTGSETSFSLEIHWILEFYSPSQVFEKIAPPPITVRWLEMQRVLAMAPAASCNPEHEGLFKSVLQKGRDAYNHYKEHQALYDGLFTALATFAKTMG